MVRLLRPQRLGAARGQGEGMTRGAREDRGKSPADPPTIFSGCEKGKEEEEKKWLAAGLEILSYYFEK